MQTRSWRRAALAAALAAAAAACGELPGGGGEPLEGAEGTEGAEGALEAAEADPYAGPVEGWVAEWALLVYAANDVRDRALARAFDADAEEWRVGLGGSALFRVLVQRDYAPFQVAPGATPRASGGRPSERYGIYRQQLFDPEAEVPEDPAACACGARPIGETDSADPATLEEFLVEGVRRFPARHYWVLVTGHGDGWGGLAFDATSGPGRRMPLAGFRRALDAAAEVIASEIRTQPGLGGEGTSDRIDVLQLDACRMGTVEVMAELDGAADFLVASRESVPDAGHPYSALHCIAQDEPGLGPRDVVQRVVADYVRAYVEGVSTRDHAYVGTSVSSVGIDLREARPLVRALGQLAEAARTERPEGFSCAEAEAIAAEAAGAEAGADARADADAGAGAGAGTPASAAAVDLASLLEVLADPARTSAAVSGAAAEALRALGGAAEAPLRFGGQYREIVRDEGPIVIAAHRIEPGSGARLPGVSVLWGAPLDLLTKEEGVSALDVYAGLRFEALTGWTGMFGACVDEARACLGWAPEPGTASGPGPCAGLFEAAGEVEGR